MKSTHANHELSYHEYLGAERFAKALIKRDKSQAGTIKALLAEFKAKYDKWVDRMDKEFCYGIPLNPGSKDKVKPGTVTNNK